MNAGIDHERGIQVGKLALQLANDLDGGVGGIAHTEHDLQLRVVLARERTQTFEQVRLGAAQRLQDRHRLTLEAWRSGCLAETPQQQRGTG